MFFYEHSFGKHCTKVLKTQAAGAPQKASFWSLLLISKPSAPSETREKSKFLYLTIGHGNQISLHLLMPQNIKRSLAHCSLSPQNTPSDSSPAPPRRKKGHREMLRGLQQTSSSSSSSVRLILSVTILYHTRRKGDSFPHLTGFYHWRIPCHIKFWFKNTCCAFLFQSHLLFCAFDEGKLHRQDGLIGDGVGP